MLGDISVDDKAGKGPLILSVGQFEGLDSIWPTFEVLELRPGQVESGEVDDLFIDHSLIKFTAVEYILATILQQIQIEVSRNYLNVGAQFSLLALVFGQQAHGRLQNVLGLRIHTLIGEVVA